MKLPQPERVMDLEKLWVTKEQLSAGRRKTEAETESELIKLIERHFDIEKQVKCKHFASDRCKRIDLIIRPRNRQRWQRDDIVFGVEIKRQVRRSLSDYTKHFSQSVDYANSWFDLTCYGDRFGCFVGFLPILTFPSFIPASSDVRTVQTLRRMAASVGVGEIGNFKWEEKRHPEQSQIENGFGIVWQGHPLWWLHSGTTKEGYTWPIHRKWGSR